MTKLSPQQERMLRALPAKSFGHLTTKLGTSGRSEYGGAWCTWASIVRRGLVKRRKNGSLTPSDAGVQWLLQTDLDRQNTATKKGKT